jgi:hypothetical protein
MAYLLFTTIVVNGSRARLRKQMLALSNMSAKLFSPEAAVKQIAVALVG